MGRKGYNLGILGKKELTSLDDVSLTGRREKEDDLQVSSPPNDVSGRVYHFVFNKAHLFRRQIKLNRTEVVNTRYSE